MCSLILKNVKFKYENSKTIFKFNDINIAKGEIISIIGKSGSGKTTLAKLIAGFLLPLNSDATIKWDNEDIVQPVSPVKIAFQDYNSAMFDLLTVKRNLSMIKEKSLSNCIFKYEDIVNKLKLKDVEANLANNLSGGQKQRVQLGRILLMQPELIILDEPDSSLDIDTKNTLIKYILEQQKTNRLSLTWIIITHDIDFAVWISSQILLLSHTIEYIDGYNQRRDISDPDCLKDISSIVNNIKNKLCITY